jgi:hypothetical protein
MKRDAVGADVDLDRAVRVGSENVRDVLLQPFHGGLRRVAVGVSGTRRDDGNGRRHRIEKRRRRRRAAAVVRHLEHVDVRQPAPDEDRIDRLLDVARQQEASPIDRAEQYDRDIVDAGAGVARLSRHRAGIRPQHVEPDLVEREAVPGRKQAGARAAQRESLGECRIPRARSMHARLEDAPDSISVEENRKPGYVVLVGVGEDERIDAAVPRRDALVERHEQPVRVRPAIDEHPPAARTLDENRVALTDVENGDLRSAVRPMHQHERGTRDRYRQSDCRQSLSASGAK